LRTCCATVVLSAGVALLSCFVMIGGCENGQSSQRGGAASGPSPQWVEHFHREQLRYEYERQQYEQQMQGR
jgi:uncharacterized protein YjaZ